MHRLEAISNIRQGARNNDGHRIIQEGFAHFLVQVYIDNLLIFVIHVSPSFIIELPQPGFVAANSIFAPISLKTCLDIKILNIFCIFFDKLAPRLHLISH